MIGTGTFVCCLIIIAIISVACVDNAVAVNGCTGQQDYSIVLYTNWTADTSPTRTFPRFAHFSPLAYAVHNRFYFMWARGMYATLGVEDVAQFGDTFELEGELDRARGNVITSVTTSSPRTVGEQVVNVTVNGDTGHTRISVISMIAPSPDWFIGISSKGRDMCRRGRFVKRVHGMLNGYDAGTAIDGFEFTDGTSPRVPMEEAIAPLDDTFMPFGMYVISRID